MMSDWDATPAFGRRTVVGGGGVVVVVRMAGRQKGLGEVVQGTLQGHAGHICHSTTGMRVKITK